MARKRSLRQLAWEKSEGTCCLCDLPMQLGLEQGSPLAYTLEHLIPKSRGGTNDLLNLGGSHRWCNQFKGEALISELPDGWKKNLRWKVRNFLIHMKV